MCSFMQALIRPWPGGTWLQNRAMSGLQALRTACAPRRICAITEDVESNRVAAVTSTFIFNIDDPPLPFGKAAILDVSVSLLFRRSCSRNEFPTKPQLNEPGGRDLSDPRKGFRYATRIGGCVAPAK